MDFISDCNTVREAIEVHDRHMDLAAGFYREIRNLSVDLALQIMEIISDPTMAAAIPEERIKTILQILQKMSPHWPGGAEPLPKREADP